jgi:hypothetical protein
MAVSLLKTLADKYDSSVNKMARKYATTIQTPHGPRKCLQVSVERGEGKKPLVARFGGIPLKRQKRAVLWDREPVPAIARHREVVRRLLAGKGASAPDPKARRPQEARTAAAARMGANHGNAAPQDVDRLRHLPRRHPRTAANRANGIVAGEPGELKGSRRVREGGVGKGPNLAPRRRPTSVVLVGPTATGRKGSSWGHVRRLLADVDDGFGRCLVGGLSSGEYLQQRLI